MRANTKVYENKSVIGGAWVAVSTASGPGGVSGRVEAGGTWGLLGGLVETWRRRRKSAK